MGEQVIKMPDIGEGVAEAELVEWEVAVGDQVREDQVLAAVMTDKATVEIPAPRDGKIIWLGPDIGEIVAVGSPIIRMEVEGDGNATPGEMDEPVMRSAVDDGSEPQSPGAAARAQEGTAPAPAETAQPDAAVPDAKPAAPAKPGSAPSGNYKPIAAVPRADGEKPLASPAVRRRAMDVGIDLRRVPGSAAANRITMDDLDAFIASGGEAAAHSARRTRDTSVDDVKIVGLRRKIAEKMATAKSRIPHITYVEEIDVTALEELRAKLNAGRGEGRPKLTLLPFLMQAMVRAIREQPQMNARYDDDANVVHRHGGMHIGVAAQTDNGLMVPVVKHVESLSLWDCAGELSRLAEAAKDGTASRDDLSGSTITITSLGAMGGIVTTPVINYPEVAIVGVNKMRIMPVWQDTQFVPRKMMNLSSSFDHRVIDGWDAAVFIQRIKALLEAPAMIFIED
ncbi:2-oxo acid dehydrogenase subunit E2 [Pacificimonas sp. WHA3]|uniref:Dihydrolipoamide acetyltransferase component of pyruvate dehydrogenase complex n=2 Tax=Pacificimonas pallii TaxID=2827236 RepID=A0ABS6SHC0_9SPHN|nr:dihydrolipoamide acetyltransferase family protein [Pacificimonas pallii]MBV7257802.1 2-oxo acid dehydrogenase subunit E2 [Pacificimonas pallii]